jgi:hypothetical protein
MASNTLFLHPNTMPLQLISNRLHITATRLSQLLLTQDLHTTHSHITVVVGEMGSLVISEDVLATTTVVTSFATRASAHTMITIRLRSLMFRLLKRRKEKRIP